MSDSWKPVFEAEATAMIQDALDYVGRDTERVQTIFVFCSFEDDAIFHNWFYRVDERVVASNIAAELLPNDANASLDDAFDLLDRGGESAERIQAAMVAAGADVPANLQMTYDVASERLEIDVEHDPQIPADDLRTSVQTIFDRWFAELGGES